MVYSIVYSAIHTKITRFEKAASLINVNEVLAAISIGCQQAGVPQIDIQIGETVEQVRERFFDAISSTQDSINPKLLTTLKAYPYGSKVVDQEALETYLYQNE